MIHSKLSKFLCMLGILMLLGQGLGQAKQGTIVKNGQVLGVKKSDSRIIVSDETGNPIFQWEAEDHNTSLKDCAYSEQHKNFVLLLEAFDPEKKSYSLVCRGPGFEENVLTDAQAPIGDAAYFEIRTETENTDQWVVFLTKGNIVSYYNFARDRLLAKEQYPTPVLGVDRSFIDGKNYLILKQGKGNAVRQFKKEFTGSRPARNPLLPME